MCLEKHFWFSSSLPALLFVDTRVRKGTPPGNEGRFPAKCAVGLRREAMNRNRKTDDGGRRIAASKTDLLHLFLREGGRVGGEVVSGHSIRAERDPDL